MGSSGSYSANVSIRYSVKQSTPNSVEDCDNFLKNHKVFLTTAKSAPTAKHIQELLDSNTNFELHYEDYESWGPYEDPIEALGEYSNESGYHLEIYSPLTSSDLVYINLPLLPKDKEIYIDDTYTLYAPILTISESIYYENDNSSTSSTEVTPRLLELLALPKAHLVLSGNGSTY